MKIAKILLSTAVFAFVGCGTTSGDPAAGLPNGGMLEIPQNNQGQESSNQQTAIDGIWYLFYDQTTDGKIDIRNFSELLELDTSGNMYDASDAQKRKIATYKYISNSQIELTGSNNDKNTIQFKNVANEEGNCFYTLRTFGQQTRDELWCKQQGTSGGSNQQGSAQGGDTRPDGNLQLSGMQVDLRDYLYPYNTLVNNGTTSENIHNYEKQQDGQLVYNGSVIKTYKKVFDPQNNEIIQEYINNSLQANKEDVIYANKIDSYSGLARESYPRQIQRNSLITEVSDNGIELRCVVQDLIAGTDLSSEIPVNIQDHLKSKVTGSTFKDDQFKYTNNIVHIRCGTTNGATIDSYNVVNYGEVLSIYNYADNTSRYEILDKYSIAHQ